MISFNKEFNDSKCSRGKHAASVDPVNQDESDFVQKKTNQLKSTPLVSVSAKSSFKKHFEPVGSFENLAKKSQHKDSTGAESTNRKSFDTSSQSNFQSRNQNSTKSLVKNLFRSGFLSNSLIQDDINIKENFCNLWVLHGDYKPVKSSQENAGSQCLKSASVNNLNLKTPTKNEEQLQREHLINLLSQLQNEEKFLGKKNSKTKYKKEKRSKSETLLTLNSLLSSELDKIDLNAKCPSRKRSSNLSTRCLNIISTPTKSNYGYFLDVNKSRENSLSTDNGSSRRFSFKNLFNRLSQKKSSTMSIVSDMDKANILNADTRQKSMSSSINSGSSNQASKVTPVGSVLKFSNGSKTKTQSDPGVNKISLSPAKSAKFKSSFKSAHEDDYDKIFSEYLNKNGSRPDFVESSDKKSGKKCKNLFKYLFKTKSCGESSLRPRRSRTLDSSIKKKMKYFTRKNSLNTKMEEMEAEPDYNESELESVKSGVSDPHRHFSLNNCDFFQIEKASRKKKASLNKSNETLYIEANLLRNKKPNDKGFLKGLMAKEKLVLNGLIDVSFEKLQQNLKGHVISIDLKNLRVEPLIEINYIKAKLSYLTLELVECDQETAMSAKRKKLMAKIHKIKVKKCKFDHNLKNLSKPIDFDLVNEHFMSVTEEAMNLQMRKMNASFEQTNGQTDIRKSMSKYSTIDNNCVKKEKKFVFYFNVELHSYIPVSRKILSSTFRKKKRIFKGQCQIHENFISSTQFTKNIVLNEI